MEENTFHIGIDFGTSRTKVCIQDASGSAASHIFLSFEGPDGQQFFIPSRLSIGPDGDVSYGFEAEQVSSSTHQYFKMAAAESDFLPLEIGERQNRREVLNRHSPLFLSSIYIAYVLLRAKSEIENRRDVSSESHSGFLSRFTKQEVQGAEFTAQLGIPTSFTVETDRAHLFRELLLLSHHLSERAASYEDYQQWDAQKLEEELEEVCTHLRSNLQSNGLDELLEDAGLSVLPESAAGLAALTMNDQLPTGFYAAMDIGAGSTDVSFFQIDKETDTIAHYITSDSLSVASNTVYQRYDGVKRMDYKKMSYAQIHRLHRVEGEVRSLIENESGTALENQSYRKAISAVTSELYESLRKLFCGPVYEYFDLGAAMVNRATGKFKHQPCLVFGGGAKLPVPKKLESVVFFTNGVPLDQIDHTADDLTETMERRSITEYIRDRQPKIRPDETTLGDNASLLAVAYGLSFPYSEATSSWDRDKDTKSKVTLQEKEHPHNEGKYVYESVREQKS